MTVPPDEKSVVDQPVFRHVIGHFATGVTVVTAANAEGLFGMTASAVTSLSMDPPMLLVCLNSKSNTCAAVSAIGRFAVNILGEEHGLVAQRFATQAPDKFDAVGVTLGPLGSPLLRDALARLECRVVQEVTGGSHRVFLAEVAHAEAGEGTPLTYYRGRFGRFEAIPDTGVYDRLRDLVLDRDITVGQELDAWVLAEEMACSGSEVQYALDRLVMEGLAGRDNERGYVVRPLDAAASDAAFDAKLVLELGVVELTVGNVTDDRLTTLRRLMQATLPYIRDGHFTDARAYERANSAFHSYVISFADNPMVPWLYERLRIPEITARALTGDVRAAPELLEEHQGLVEAYERGDLPAAREVVKAHSERSKQTQRAGIESAGGAI